MGWESGMVRARLRFFLWFVALAFCCIEIGGVGLCSSGEDHDNVVIVV